MKKYNLSFSRNIVTISIFLSFIFACHLNTIKATSILIIGSNEKQINQLIPFVKNDSVELVGIVPNYSFENPLNAIEKISYSFRNKMKDNGILLSNVLHTKILDSCTDVIILSYKKTLDFNSVIKVITSQKNIILEQPNIFDLSEAMLMYALATKYDIDIDIYFNKDQYDLLNILDFGIEKVVKQGDSISMKSNITTFSYTMNAINDNYFINLNGILKNETKTYETKLLQFFTLLHAIEKCRKSEEDVEIILDDLYYQAFYEAYNKMEKFN